MRCIKCGIKNITSANYCKRCANKFTKKEQKKSRQKTIVGKIELIENVYNTCTLKIITDHIIFKICSLLIVLGIGIYFWVNNGLDLKLLNGDNYDIQYNIKEDEYYFMTSNTKVFLNLYVPNRTEEIVVKHYDKSNEIIEEKKYKPTEEIVLETKENEYYILNANYLHNDSDSFKFYVLQKD